MPMAGSGKRFADEGYTELKSLIKIGGKAMVAHACDSFPNDADIEFIFICNKEHLDTTNLADVLKSVRPNSQIIPINPDNNGPVTSVLLAEKSIPDNEEVIVNYCDFAMEWDYERFIKEMHSKKADGGIPAFRGFQPAQFTGTKYAYLRLDDSHVDSNSTSELRVLEIREKESFTDNKLNEFASTGTYYFRTGSLMKKVFPRGGPTQPACWPRKRILCKPSIQSNDKRWIAGFCLRGQKVHLLWDSCGRTPL